MKAEFFDVPGLGRCEVSECEQSHQTSYPSSVVFYRVNGASLEKQPVSPNQEVVERTESEPGNQG